MKRYSDRHRHVDEVVTGLGKYGRLIGHVLRLPGTEDPLRCALARVAFGLHTRPLLWNVRYTKLTRMCREFA
jgi:hypothetical protein